MLKYKYKYSYKSEPILHLECKPIHDIQNIKTANRFYSRRNEQGCDRIAVESLTTNAHNRPGTNNKDWGDSMLVYA